MSDGPEPEPEPETINIPNVVGWTVADAKHRLEGLGFEVYVANNMPDTAFVTSTTPSGSAEEGATVTIYAQNSSSGSETEAENEG